MASKIYESGKPGTRASPFAKIISESGIQRTSEFLRIERLPRRDWANAPDIKELTEQATYAFKTPGGTMEFWTQQAAALRDIFEVKGALCPIAVGAGKALITLCAPVALDAQRPILLLPASLRDQTLLKVIPEMRKHWKLHRNLAVIGYEELSLAKNATLLETLQPDLIIADEVHKLRSTKAGRTRRISRYMRAFPQTMFVGLSGTITKRSIRDYWHVLAWALKTDLMPLPTNWREMQDWADCIDENPPVDRHVRAGVLLRFCGEKLDPKTKKMRTETVREGYQRRLTETPGVIATGENELGVSLLLQRREVSPPEKVMQMISNLEATWETPNGDEIVDAITMWQHEREMGCGFWNKWEPAAPKEWLKARKAWNKYVRTTLGINRRGLDTPLQVWMEMEKATGPKGHWAGDEYKAFPGVAEFRAWKAIHNTFKPNSVAVWEDDFLLRDATEWLNNKQPGIVWVEHVPFGERLSEMSGFPYFGGGKKAGIEILDVTGPIIVSVGAHREGRNMQDRWSRNLIVSPPPTGSIMEQVIGRTHRSGQQADEVTVEFYLFVEGQRRGFLKSVSDAKYIEETTGNRQKLCYATTEFQV